MSNIKLANLIFPEVSDTIEDLEKRFPHRNLKEGAQVTRFAPSPTGFLHTGSLFTAFISRYVAKQTGGVFFVRLEDTDTKREVSGSGNLLLEEMEIFQVAPDEGYLGEREVGNYGPYKQSERGDIYKTVIKQMVKDGNAYPCFCSNEELTALRATQEANKVVPGYYGHYATCSRLTSEEAATRIKNGEPYVMRFRSKGNHNNKITINDLVRGTIEIAENDQHIIILKSDGLPTYHFAHACDDHFMRTTLVTRGEEWLSSVPLHVELFTTLNFQLPQYAHLPVINKLDNGNKRKLSKRKDEEAAVTYFLRKGYPVEAVLTYLLSIANSNFEEWWTLNRDRPITDFPFSFGKMSLDGALFDIEKVNFFAREYIASLTAKEAVEGLKQYAMYVEDQFLLDNIANNYELFVNILNIERETIKPRKDFAYYSAVYPSIKFFLPEEFDLMIENNEIESFNDAFSNELIKKVLTSFKTDLVYEQGNEVWFNSLKTIALTHGFATNNKEFKNNPEQFVGQVGDVAEMLRIAIVGSKKSPNLYEVLSILRIEETNRRIDKIMNILQ